MVGATNPNPDVIKPESSIVRKTASNRWQLMTNDTELDANKGEFIKTADAKKLKHLRRSTNATKSAMRKEYQERGYRAWDEVPADERDEIERAARQERRDAFDKLDELQKRDDLSPSERARRAREIRRDAFDS